MQRRTQEDGDNGGKGAVDRGSEDLNVGQSLREAREEDREGATGTRAVARRWNADCKTEHKHTTKYFRTSSTTIPQ